MLNCCAHTPLSNTHTHTCTHTQAVLIQRIHKRVASSFLPCATHHSCVQEERGLLLRDPPSHHAAWFDPAWLVPVPVPAAAEPEEEEATTAGAAGGGGGMEGEAAAAAGGGGGGGGRSLVSADQLLRVARIWAEVRCV